MSFAGAEARIRELIAKYKSAQATYAAAQSAYETDAGDTRDIIELIRAYSDWHCATEPECAELLDPIPKHTRILLQAHAQLIEARLALRAAAVLRESRHVLTRKQKALRQITQETIDAMRAEADDREELTDELNRITSEYHGRMAELRRTAEEAILADLADIRAGLSEQEEQVRKLTTARTEAEHTHASLPSEAAVREEVEAEYAEKREELTARLAGQERLDAEIQEQIESQQRHLEKITESFPHSLNKEINKSLTELVALLASQTAEKQAQLEGEIAKINAQLIQRQTLSDLTKATIETSAARAAARTAFTLARQERAVPWSNFQRTSRELAALKDRFDKINRLLVRARSGETSLHTVNTLKDELAFLDTDPDTIRRTNEALEQLEAREREAKRNTDEYNTDIARLESELRPIPTDTELEASYQSIAADDLRTILGDYQVTVEAKKTTISESLRALEAELTYKERTLAEIERIQAELEAKRANQARLAERLAEQRAQYEAQRGAVDTAEKTASERSALAEKSAATRETLESAGFSICRPLLTSKQVWVVYNSDSENARTIASTLVPGLDHENNIQQDTEVSAETILEASELDTEPGESIYMHALPQATIAEQLEASSKSDGLPTVIAIIDSAEDTQAFTDSPNVAGVLHVHAPTGIIAIEPTAFRDKGIISECFRLCDTSAIESDGDGELRWKRVTDMSAKHLLRPIWHDLSRQERTEASFMDTHASAIARSELEAAQEAMAATEAAQEQQRQEEERLVEELAALQADVERFAELREEEAIRSDMAALAPQHERINEAANQLKSLLEQLASNPESAPTLIERALETLDVITIIDPAKTIADLRRLQSKLDETKEEHAKTSARRRHVAEEASRVRAAYAESSQVINEDIETQLHKLAELYLAAFTEKKDGLEAEIAPLSKQFESERAKCEILTERLTIAEEDYRRATDAADSAQSACESFKSEYYSGVEIIPELEELERLLKKNKVQLQATIALIAHIDSLSGPYTVENVAPLLAELQHPELPTPTEVLERLRAIQGDSASQIEQHERNLVSGNQIIEALVKSRKPIADELEALHAESGEIAENLKAAIARSLESRAAENERIITTLEALTAELATAVGEQARLATLESKTHNASTEHHYMVVKQSCDALSTERNERLSGIRTELSRLAAIAAMADKIERNELSDEDEIPPALSAAKGDVVIWRENIATIETLLGITPIADADEEETFGEGAAEEEKPLETDDDEAEEGAGEEAKHSPVSGNQTPPASSSWWPWSSSPSKEDGGGEPPGP